MLRYDTRGHGESGTGSSPYTFDQLTGDIKALCTRLSIDKADFLGLSLGGMTVLEFALRYPQMVGRLVCCDARADAPDPYKAIWDGNIAKLNEGGIAAICEPTLSRWFTSSFLSRSDNQETLDTVRSMIQTTAVTGYEGSARCLQQLDLLDRLPSLACPVLYVVGEHDPAAPLSVMQEMCERTPDAELSVIADAAHLSNMEQPKAFTDSITGFLNL